MRAYYILNMATVLTYFVARDVALFRGGMARAVRDNMIEWERNAFSSLGVLLAIKGVRTLTLDSFISDFFMYTKSVILMTSMYLDIRLFVWYLILMTILFLMVPQPFYEGPEDITYLTPATYDELVVAGKMEGADKKARWLVEFYATWSPPCVHLEPIFAQLSVKYASSKLQFAKMDLGRWPRIAKEFNIHTGGSSKQLPTLIMFENGKEIGRIPHVFADGSVAKGRYRKTDIIKAFDLENEGASLSTDFAKKESKRGESSKKKK